MTKERNNVAGRNFGEALQVSVFALKGSTTPELCHKIDSLIINSIKMNDKGLRPHTWSYPTEDNKGGNGITLVQPLVESFIAWDTWLDHNGAFLFVVSCKEYDISLVIDILSQFFEVKQRNEFITQF